MVGGEGEMEDASMDSGIFAEAESGDSKVSTIVEVDLGNRSYPIFIGFGLPDEPDLLRRYSRLKIQSFVCFPLLHYQIIVLLKGPGGNYTTIASLYLDKVFKAFTRGNYKISVESVILPDGEANMVGLLEKPLLLSFDHLDCNISIVNQFFLRFLQKTLTKVFDKAIESRMDQHCTFVALGGGVIGDMCGFAAAFLHGANFIQILTTLIA